MNTNSIPQISVVIPTLGGKELLGTIKALNSGTIKPSEILICIPEKISNNITKLNIIDNNIVIIKTTQRGQVFQRSIGFKCARNDIVVQLDDDVILAPDCLENLHRMLMRLGIDVSLSPAFYNAESKESVYKKSKQFRLYQSLYYRLINGKQGLKMGVVDLTGSPIGVDPEYVKDDFYPVEWLPGGCVMHHKKNLIINNYFPLPGKAYCEDLIHSYILVKNNIKLYVCIYAKCFIKIEKYTDFNLATFIQSLKNDFSARKYYLKSCNKYTPRVFIFYTFMIFNYLKKVIFK